MTSENTFSSDELLRLADEVFTDNSEATMRRDRFYIIRTRFYIGAPACLWAEDAHYIETSDMQEVINHLSYLEGSESVIYVDLVNGTSSDVSKTFALRVAELIRDGSMSITDDLRNFIEEHFPPGSVIPAAS